jgi:phage terminase small subunit
MALTDKKRRFVNARAEGASNKEAAIAAGCAPASASAAGSRMAKDPEIVAALGMLNQGAAVKPQRRVKEQPDAAVSAPGDSEDNGEYLHCLPITDDPLAWLLALMNEPSAKVFDRRNAAQTAVPYVHGKKGEAGKKEQKADAAKQVSKGKYGQGKPPLTVVKG